MLKKPKLPPAKFTQFCLLARRAALTAQSSGANCKHVRLTTCLSSIIMSNP